MTNSTAIVLIVLLAFILVALVVLVMVLITRQSDPPYTRSDVIGEYVLDDLERFHAMTLATIQSVLNPYNEHDQPPLAGTPGDTVTVLETELDDEPDFNFDPTDILIPTTPDHQPTMLVPPGFDPVPHADNDEIALAARNAAHSQIRDDDELDDIRIVEPWRS